MTLARRMRTDQIRANPPDPWSITLLDNAASVTVAYRTRFGPGMAPALTTNGGIINEAQSITRSFNHTSLGGNRAGSRSETRRRVQICRSEISGRRTNGLRSKRHDRRSRQTYGICKGKRRPRYMGTERASGGTREEDHGRLSGHRRHLRNV